jgi:hypothetical protein
MHRLVVALVTLLGLTGAAFVAGWLFVFSAGTDRAATLAPARTAVYLNVYLQPSAGQQMNLAGLIGRLPGFADDATLDEKVDQVVQNLLAGTGIDYRQQLKPWLGNQVALAAWPDESDQADAADGEAVLIVEVKDREAAERSVAELLADGATFAAESYEGVELRVSDDAAYAFVADMLVVAEDPASVRAVIDVERGADALAGRDDFTRTMDELPDDHLATVFVDVGTLAGAFDAADQVAAMSTAGGALVAERDGLRLSGSAPFDMDGAEASARAGFALGTEPSSLVEWMPQDTLAELVVFGLRQTLEDAEAAAGATPEGQELLGTLDTIRALAAFGLGIDLDADVLPLLDREVALAVTGFDGELPSGLLLLRPDDGAAAAESLDRIASRLAVIGASVRTDERDGTPVTIVSLPDTGEIAYAVVDRIVIMALTADDVVGAIDAHARGATLAASEVYRRTFELAGTRAGNEAFVNVRALVALMDGVAELSDDERDILGQIGSFGFTAPSRENKIEFHAVLTVEETRPE